MKINETSAALRGISESADELSVALSRDLSSINKGAKTVCTFNKTFALWAANSSPSGKQRAWARRELRRLGVTI